MYSLKGKVNQKMFSRLVSQLIPMTSKSLIGKNTQKQPIFNQIVRRCHRVGRDTEQTPPRHSLKEKLLAPAGPRAFDIGRGSLIGGSALGLGALCYFGLGMNKDATNIMNHSIFWPEYVSERIHDTYAYFGGSVIITAASAAATFRSPVLLGFFARTGWMSMLTTMALMLSSGLIVLSIPYEGAFGTKQFAWAVHCAIMGSTLAPLSFVGGPILIKAAWYTAGAIGGLSVVATCAPNDRFLNMGGHCEKMF